MPPQANRPAGNGPGSCVCGFYWPCCLGSSAALRLSPDCYITAIVGVACTGTRLPTASSFPSGKGRRPVHQRHSSSSTPPDSLLAMRDVPKRFSGLGSAMAAIGFLYIAHPYRLSQAFVRAQTQEVSSVVEDDIVGLKWWPPPPRWLQADNATAQNQTSANGTSGNGTTDEGSVTSVSSSRDKVCDTSCCEDVVLEAKLACQLEYRTLGGDEAQCAIWSERASMACIESCGNCTEIATAVYEHCLFWGGNRFPGVRGEVCEQTRTDMEFGRCKSTCQVGRKMCREKKADWCMERCGNYQECNCGLPKNLPMAAVACEGATLIQGQLEGYEDGVVHRCEQVPDTCRHDVAAPAQFSRLGFKVPRTDLLGTMAACGPYKHCPLNHCLVKKITCPIVHMCQKLGVCNPVDGSCGYTFHKDGHPCDDGLSYTKKDACQDGECVGVPDLCEKHGIECDIKGPCVGEGTCLPHTGSCVYERVEDGTICDDSTMSTVDDRCFDGICIGRQANLCVELNVLCEKEGPCQDSGHCDPATGICELRPVSDASVKLCDDGDSWTDGDRCLAGLCVGDPYRQAYQKPVFQMLGMGMCVDRGGRRMPRYYGDVLSDTSCEEICAQDVQCLAYGYSFPVCSLFGTVVRGPPSEYWAYQEGSEPPAIAIEGVVPPTMGEPEAVCRRKTNVVKDEEFYMDPASVMFAVPSVMLLMLIFTSCFFHHRILKCLKECCCARVASRRSASTQNQAQGGGLSSWGAGCRDRLESLTEKCAGCCEWLREKIPRRRKAEGAVYAIDSKTGQCVPPEKPPSQECPECGEELPHAVPSWDLAQDASGSTASPDLKEGWHSATQEAIPAKPLDAGDGMTLADVEDDEATRVRDMVSAAILKTEPALPSGDVSPVHQRGMDGTQFTAQEHEQVGGAAGTEGLSGTQTDHALGTGQETLPSREDIHASEESTLPPEAPRLAW